MCARVHVRACSLRRHWPKNKPDASAADRKLFEGHGRFVLQGQLHGLQVCVHRHVHTYSGDIFRHSRPCRMRMGIWVCGVCITQRLVFGETKLAQEHCSLAMKPACAACRQLRTLRPQQGRLQLPCTLTWLRIPSTRAECSPKSRMSIMPLLHSNHHAAAPRHGISMHRKRYVRTCRPGSRPRDCACCYLKKSAGDTGHKTSRRWPLPHGTTLLLSTGMSSTRFAVCSNPCVPRIAPERTWGGRETEPTIVPVTTAPFLSSMVTVSCVSFIRNFTSFIVPYAPLPQPLSCSSSLFSLPSSARARRGDRLPRQHLLAN
jgi:hypothetical protein